jgi:hypothetical protein
MVVVVVVLVKLVQTQLALQVETEAMGQYHLFWVQQ